MHTRTPEHNDDAGAALLPGSSARAGYARRLNDGWVNQVGTILDEADNLRDVILELAKFGATFALMGEPKRRTNLATGEVGHRHT